MRIILAALASDGILASLLITGLLTSVVLVGFNGSSEPKHVPGDCSSKRPTNTQEHTSELVRARRTRKHIKNGGV